MRRHCEGDRDRDRDEERDRDGNGMHRKALFLLHILDHLDVLKEVSGKILGIIPVEDPDNDYISKCIKLL